MTFTLHCEPGYARTVPQFAYEFDEPQKNLIHFDYSPDAGEAFATSVEAGVPVLYLNRSGLLTLAKTLIRMSMGPYTDGFHVHLQRNFDADQPECLTITLHEQNAHE
jgi:hypothetical protein